jgi:hypothetical protein
MYRVSKVAKATEAIREMDQSLADYFVDSFDGSEIVKNIFELDFLAARLARVSATKIAPATLFSAMVNKGYHPDDAILYLQEYYRLKRSETLDLLKNSQTIRLSCFNYLAKNVKL